MITQSFEREELSYEELFAAADEIGTRIAAYELDTAYRFNVLLINRRTGEERCEVVVMDNDRFCNVVAHVNLLFPGWAVIESWEVA